MPDPGVRSENEQSLEPQKPLTSVVTGVSDRELWDKLKAAKGKVTVYDTGLGDERTFELKGRSARPRPGTRISLDMRPTPPSPEVVRQAYDDAAGFLKAIETEHPVLTNTILNNPNMLYLLPEISMMLGGEGSIGLGIDVVGGLLDAMPGAVGYRSYAETMFETPVQQMFWGDVASKFDSGAKDITSYIFGGLTEKGANRVASLAFAWLRENPLETQEDQNNLLLRLWNWGEREQQSDILDSGLMGALDLPQEQFQKYLLEVPLLAGIGDPEEAIQRSGLTLGQQAAYQLGLNPDDTMWELSSGAIDAWGEVVVDPINLAIGLGAGFKAAETVPLGIKATKAGRAFFAAKSAIPFLGRHVEGALQTRSLSARVTYAFKGRTVNQLFDMFGKTHAGQEAYDLLKAGNRARFLDRFPQMERLPDSFFEGAKYLNSPQDMAEHMKLAHYNDNFLDPGEINRVSKELDDAKSALSRAENTFRELTRLKMGNPVAPDDALRIDVFKAQMKLDMLKTEPNQVFVVTDLPRRPNTRFLNRSSVRGFFDKGGNTRNTLARWASDLTQGVPGEIDLFDSRKGVKQIRQVLEHYGVQPTKVDEMLNEFLRLDLGERMHYVANNLAPAIGDATKNPLLRYNLVECYKRVGERAFAAGGESGSRLDEYQDAAGDWHRLPILDTDLQRAFPLPIKEMDHIIRRFNGAKKLRAIGMGRGGLVGGTGFTMGGKNAKAWKQVSTRARRQQLVTRLRNKMGEGAFGKDDEDIYAAAYSWLGDGRDPRGWMSHAVHGFNTGVLKPLDITFRKMALGLRPIQWMFKVVLMEEQLRSHVYEMPNMYTKPLGWVSEVMTNHYMNKADDWARKQAEWVDTVRTQIFSGVNTVDEAVAVVRAEFGKAADDILGKRTFRTALEVQRRTGKWMHKAGLSSSSVKHLRGGQRLDRAMRARRLEKVAAIKRKELLDPDFRPVDDIQEIMGRTINTMFGENLSTSLSGVRAFPWNVKQSGAARHAYGRAWASKVTELTKSGATKWALRRMLKETAGEDARALSPEAFMQTGTWRLMKGNIRKFFPNEETDALRVERYLNEKINPYIEDILKPVLSQGNIDRVAFLDQLLKRRKFTAEVNGMKYDIDLRSEGAAHRQLADFVVDQGDFARTTPFPSEIAAVDTNFRFLDASADKKAYRRALDWSIQTFGEDATQVMTRRPFWRAQRRKWLKIYRGMGVPDGIAATLATERATKMVNYVMYDLSEAPVVIKKLNNMIPFFGATYEVLGTWAYKMPVAVGGYWPIGVSGFARKIDRMMRAFVNTGITTVSVNDEGKRQYDLQLWREPDTGTAVGDALGKIGYFARRTPEVAIAHLLSVWPQFNADEALKMSEAGYGFSLGNPLNPMDFGMLSFAQFRAGLNPATNWVASEVMGRFAPAADVQRVESGDAPITLAELADKLEVEVDDLAKANRQLIISSSDGNAYKGLFEDDVDPMDIVIPAGSLVTIPGSSLFETLAEDTVFPFGEIETPGGVIRGMLPAVYHHAMRGLGLMFGGADEAWMDDSGELDGIMLFDTKPDEAAVNSQILEAFYYIESTEGVFSEQIFPLQKQYTALLKKVEAGTATNEEKAKADSIKDELELLSDETIKRATDMAGGSLILRSLGGSFFPNTGRTLRKEMTMIDTYWDSRDFAEQLRGTDSEGQPMITVPMSRMKKIEDIDAFFAEAGAWLEDPTGDRARAFIRENHPSLFAYLQPKTFWGPGGIPPEITSYEDYLDQIEAGERKPVPLAVAIQRHLHAGVETDYWINFVNTFGNDPEAAASAALDNYGLYNDLQDERHSAKDALFMSDDLHGGEYLEWLDGRGTHDDDEYEVVEEAIDKQREAYDMLQDMLDLELDATMEPAEILDHRKIIKTTLARFGEVIDELTGDEEGTSWKNPYELAMDNYWTTIYEDFEKGADELWDAIGASEDTEATSLAFENLKLYMNQWSGTRHALGDRTDITYPSPLDIKWNRKTEEEKQAYVLKRSTLPLEWLSLDDVDRIMERVPADAAQFFPQTHEDMKIYTEWTLKKNEIEELKEAGKITQSQATDAQAEVKKRTLSYLLEAGRTGEAMYMNMWPIEQLYVLGLLPQELEYLMPEVRFVRETLNAEGVTPRSNVGDKLLIPMYNTITNRAQTDIAFGTMLRNLGMTIFDEQNYDSILPALIADDRSDY